MFGEAVSPPSPQTLGLASLRLIKEMQSLKISLEICLWIETTV